MTLRLTWYSIHELYLYGNSLYKFLIKLLVSICNTGYEFCDKAMQRIHMHLARVKFCNSFSCILEFTYLHACLLKCVLSINIFIFDRENQFFITQFALSLLDLLYTRSMNYNLAIVFISL